MHEGLTLKNVCVRVKSGRGIHSHVLCISASFINADFFSVPALGLPDGQVFAEVLDANATVMRIELQTNFIGPDGAKAKRLRCDFSCGMICWK